MLKFMTLTLFIFVSLPLFSVLKSYNEEKSEWCGNADIFYQYLEEDGQLTEKALECALPHLSIFKGYQVEVHLLGEAEHGAQTQQLFSLIVSDLKNEEKKYIIKVYKELETVNSIETLGRLFSIKNSPLKIYDLDNVELSSDMPRVAFDVWSGTYEDRNRKIYGFSIFKKAPGVSFNKIINAGHSGGEKLDLKDIYRHLGKVIASMHLKFSSFDGVETNLGDIKTMACHGDLQAPNIFYCSEKNIFTLIDYEFFGFSLVNSLPIKYDFAKLLPFDYVGQLEESIPLAFSLIEGYASVWPDSLGIKDMLESYVLKKINKKKGLIAKRSICYSNK